MSVSGLALIIVAFYDVALIPGSNFCSMPGRLKTSCMNAIAIWSGIIPPIATYLLYGRWIVYTSEHLQ